MRLNGTEWQSGNMGGVRMAVAERKAEHGAGAALRREGVHGALNVEARAVVRRRCVRGRGVRVAEVASSGFAAVMIKKAAVGDTQQPPANIVNIREFMGHPKRFEKSLLRQLVSEGTIPTKSAQESSDRALMGADNGVKCVDL